MEIFFNALLSVEHYQGIDSDEPSMKPQFIDRQTLLQTIRNMRAQTKARDSGTGDHRDKLDSEWRFIGLKKGFSSVPLDSLSKGASRELIQGQTLMNTRHSLYIRPGNAQTPRSLHIYINSRSFS